MAVITFNEENNSVAILVEKTDSIRQRDDSSIYTQRADSYPAGYMFVNEQVNLCMMRGDR